MYNVAYDRMGLVWVSSCDPSQLGFGAGLTTLVLRRWFLVPSLPGQISSK